MQLFVECNLGKDSLLWGSPKILVILYALKTEDYQPQNFIGNNHMLELLRIGFLA
jgi:hypothetical protein